MAVSNELSAPDHQPGLSHIAHALNDYLTVSHQSSIRQSRDSKSCGSATSRTSKKSALSDNLRASSFRIPRSDQSLHQDSAPKRYQIEGTSTPRPRSSPSDTQDMRTRSSSKCSKSTEKRPERDGENKGPKLRKHLDNNQSVSSTRSRSKQLELESSQSLASRAGSSCNSIKSQKSRNASTSSKTTSEGRTQKARSNSCEDRKASLHLQENRRPSTKGSMYTSGRSTSLRRKSGSSKIPRGIDPPSTQLVLADISPSKQ